MQLFNTQGYFHIGGGGYLLHSDAIKEYNYFKIVYESTFSTFNIDYIPSQNAFITIANNSTFFILSRTNGALLASSAQGVFFSGADARTCKINHNATKVYGTYYLQSFGVATQAYLYMFDYPSFTNGVKFAIPSTSLVLDMAYVRFDNKDYVAAPSLTPLGAKIYEVVGSSFVYVADVTYEGNPFGAYGMSLYNRSGTIDCIIGTTYGTLNILTGVFTKIRDIETKYTDRRYINISYDYRRVFYGHANARSITSWDLDTGQFVEEIKHTELSLSAMAAYPLADKLYVTSANFPSALNGFRIIEFQHI